MKFLSILTTWMTAGLALFSKNGTPSQRRSSVGTANKTSTLIGVGAITAGRKTPSHKPSEHDLARIAAAEAKRKRRMERNKNV